MAFLTCAILVRVGNFEQKLELESEVASSMNITEFLSEFAIYSENSKLERFF